MSEGVTYQFDKINKDFLGQIDSVKETLPFVMLIISANDGKANKDLMKFVEENGIEEKDESGEEYFSFTPEDGHKFRILEKNAEVASAALDIIPNSLFVSLISQFDSFLGKMIREIFKVKPEILNSSEKSLSFAQLIKLNSFEEAKEYIIEKEVETILRNSHTDHFNWLEQKLNIPLRKDLPIWSDFLEITERRNLFVHSDGYISNQYLSICRQNSVKLNGEKIGQRLNVSAEYFEKAYKCLYEISVKLTQVIWRKLLPIDIESADASLNDICVELLRQKHFDLADIFLDFATLTLKKFFNEETKNVFIINKALSYKLGGKQSECEDLIKAKDWSASSDKFKLAVAVLVDDHPEMAKLMAKMGSGDDIDKLSYKIWPLFEPVRELELFKTTYEKIFKEKFVLVDTPKKLIEMIIQKKQVAEDVNEEYKGETKEV